MRVLVPWDDHRIAEKGDVVKKLIERSVPLQLAPGPWERTRLRLT